MASSPIFLADVFNPNAVIRPHLRFYYQSARDFLSASSGESRKLKIAVYLPIWIQRAKDNFSMISLGLNFVDENTIWLLVL